MGTLADYALHNTDYSYPNNHFMLPFPRENIVCADIALNGQLACAKNACFFDDIKSLKMT